MSSKSFPDWYTPEDGEEPYVVTHPHSIIYWERILMGFMLIGIAVWFYKETPGLLDNLLTQSQVLKISAAIGLFGTLFSLAEYIIYKTTWYLITSNYVVKRDSIFTDWMRTSDPIHISEVRDFTLTQSLFQLIIGCGTITIQTAAGTQHPDINFGYIPQGERVEKILQQLQNADTGSASQQDVENNIEGL